MKDKRIKSGKINIPEKYDFDINLIFGKTIRYSTLLNVLAKIMKIIGAITISLLVTIAIIISVYGYQKHINEDTGAHYKTLILLSFAMVFTMFLGIRFINISYRFINISYIVRFIFSFIGIIGLISLITFLTFNSNLFENISTSIWVIAILTMVLLVSDLIIHLFDLFIRKGDRFDW